MDTAREIERALGERLVASYKLPNRLAYFGNSALPVTLNLPV
jgi:hypothetical protein